MIDRAEWLAWRRQGIGGSDIAALVGMSPWSTPMTVWLDKTGQLPDDEGSEIMSWGQLLEGVIGEEFERRTGLHIAHRQLMRFDSAHPICRATLDALVFDDGAAERACWNGAYYVHDAIGTLELKNTSIWDRGDEIPEHFELQAQWQLGISRLARGWLAVLHRGNRLRIHEIKADPRLYEDLVEIAETFWRDHVVTGEPPPVDGREATSDAIKAAYADATAGSELEVDLTVVALVARLLSAKTILKQNEEQVAQFENEIKLALGDAEVATFDGRVVVTWKSQTSKRFDRDRFQAEQPDLYDAYVKESSARVLRPKKAKEPK